MKKILFIIVCVLNYTQAQSQGGSSITIAIEKDTINNKNEPILYKDIVRRYTWLEGKNKISQEVADTLPYYFRLSKKNKSGHYQIVEALKGTKSKSITSIPALIQKMVETLKGTESGTDHPLNTDFANKYNDRYAKNQESRKDLTTIGKWELYSDSSGENVVEERAYESKSDSTYQLVYAMQVVRNDSTHATLTYLNYDGLPIDFNYNGSVVRIGYKNDGCDSIIGGNENNKRIHK